MNTFGSKLRLSIFGESHGECIGITMDGVPAGLPIDTQDFTADILRRKSGGIGTTPRKEPDVPEIVSGLFNGHTTGAPLTVLFKNTNTRSSDYGKIAEIPRPGHADFTASVKYKGFNDIRGGGHFSGRLTLCLVAAGTVAKKILSGSISAKLKSIAGEEDEKRWEGLIAEALKEGDSLGGVIECVCTGIPAGTGEPFFDSVESEISHIIFSIPGIRGIEFGDGFKASQMKGSQHNDCIINKNGTTETNGAGGINGGITNGNPIVFRVAVKPTSSISKTQKSLNFKTGKEESFSISGRHDCCIALRCPVIIEAAAAIALVNLI